MTVPGNEINEPAEGEVGITFLSDDEFEAKDWPEYGAVITPEFTEEEFQQEFCDIIKDLENALLLEGWKRGLLKPHDDYDISMDCSRIHRSLDIGIISDRVLCPTFLPILAGFLRRQRNRWMLHISDERWSPDTGYCIDFKLVVEPDMIWIVQNGEDILGKLGLPDQTS